MTRRTKARRREAFRVNALAAYGWSWCPLTQYREAQPDWSPPTGPGVSLDLGMAK